MDCRRLLVNTNIATITITIASTIITITIASTIVTITIEDFHVNIIIRNIAETVTLVGKVQKI